MQWLALTWNMGIGYWVLGRAQIYRTSTVYATGQLPLLQHYILGSLAFFTLLCTPVLYPVLSLRPAMGWVRRLKAAGRSVAAFAEAQIAGSAVALLAMLMLLAVGTGAWALFAGQTVAVGFGLLLGLLLCAAFAACFGFLCCNAGGVMPASLLAFFCAVLGLFVAGGVLPPVLLPGGIARVAPYTPLALMRQALAPLFGQPTNGTALLLLLVWVALLYAGCMLLGRGKGRNPVEVEE